MKDKYKTFLEIVMLAVTWVVCVFVQRNPGYGIPLILMMLIFIYFEILKKDKS